MNIDSSGDIYDALAAHYREYSEKRAPYLRAVEAFVARRAPAGAQSLLDVGAGDGVRGAALAQGLGMTRLVLAEPSEKMAELCAKQHGAVVWRTTAEALPLDQGRFDVILCLWNVLGHMPGRRARVAGLRRLAALLAPGGRLFLDVNNRHNAASYGWGKVAWRVVVDAVKPDERRGDSSFEWEIDGRRIPAMGHLFTPAEMDGLLRAGGLRTVRRVCVDYATGAESENRFSGQLVYEAARANDGAQNDGAQEEG